MSPRLRLYRPASRAPFNLPLDRRSIRMSSMVTIVGQSGREYIQGEVLQRSRQDPRLHIYQASSGGRSFVLKRVSESFFDLSQRLRSEFAGTRRLRMHVDHNQDGRVLIYDYFRDTLLALIRKHPNFPVAERKKILRLTGEALQEFHAKHWIHIDVKPDNILVDWTGDDESNQQVTNVALGDFDIAFKLEGEDGTTHRALQTRHAIGNAMWRSPEGQTGRGITKASDIFSFGLVCIYTLGGGELLLLDDWRELEKAGIKPEQEILVRHFTYFGPLRQHRGGLLDQVNDEVWSLALTKASEMAELTAKDHPGHRFKEWGGGLGPQAVSVISGMTDLEPLSRPTIDEVLSHDWWQEEDVAE